MLQLLWFISCLLMWVSSRELVLKQIWFGRKGYWIVPWLHWPRDEPRQTFPTCLTCSLNLAEAGFILIGGGWQQHGGRVAVLLEQLAVSLGSEVPCQESSRSLNTALEDELMLLRLLDLKGRSDRASSSYNHPPACLPPRSPRGSLAWPPCSPPSSSPPWPDGRHLPVRRHHRHHCLV